MEDHPLYGKRKKKREKVANPLFVEWLTEWREEAAEKGWKSQYTYGKALTTLKKFPLTLSSGKDCKILENFGDKICKMLDDKLAEHIATHGTTAPVTTTNTVTDVVSCNNKKTDKDMYGGSGKLGKSRHNEHKRQNSQENRAAGGRSNSQDGVAGGDQNSLRGHRVHELSDSSDGEDAQPARKRQRSGRKSGEREYIPTYRSGPYAILLTLYRDMQSGDSRGFMTKAELIRAAQHLADKSFSIPDPGCRYTSWSSMGTLIKKGLVIKESSPAKYYLTDAGCELAHRLEAVKGDNKDDDNDDIPFQMHQPQPQRQGRDSPPRQPQTTGLVKIGPTGKSKHAVADFGATSPRLPQLPNFDDDGDDDDDDSNAGTSHALDMPARLQYWYVTEEGKEVLEKDKAVVTIDNEISIGFLAKCKYTEVLKSVVRYKLDTSRPLGDDFVYVYLHNDDAADVATPPVTTVPLRQTEKKKPDTDTGTTQNVKKKKAGNAETTRAKKAAKPSKASKPQLLPLIQSLEKDSDAQTESKPSLLDSESNSIEPFVVDSEDSSLDSLPSLGLKSRVLKKMEKISTIVDDETPICPRLNSQELKSRQSSIGSNFKNSKLPNEPRKTKDDLVVGPSRVFNSNSGVPKYVPKLDFQDSHSQESSQNSIQSLSSVSSVASLQSLPKPDFVLLPGEFDIVLCVDNAEYYGASKGSCKTLLPDLLKNGIDCELRKLHVGDLLWVAKEKVRPLPGQLEKPQGKELVLDYIIERKRMDDLVSSCIDGRFKEQKFRLKKCGLRFPMYLIEDYGSMQHFSIPEKTIKQAITNTQVIDGFQVKRTKDTKETVAFLTVMTRYLQSSFRDKTLYASSLEDLKEFSQTFTIDDSEQRLATFEEFNQGSVKTKALTVQEMLGKQLIQLHGMSAEKARAVIDLYPTPTHLFAAYDRCSTEISKETLLSGIKCGKASRNLGIAQSKQIYQLYCTKSALK